MKHTVTEILDVAVVTIALFAIIAIIQWMTTIGSGTVQDGFVTQNIKTTVESIFTKTSTAINVGD